MSQATKDKIGMAVFALLVLLGSDEIASLLWNALK